MKDCIWVVFRKYTELERPDEADRYVLYGWTNSKDVIQCFKQQRSKKKYEIVKYSVEDPVVYRLDVDRQENMIDFIKLKFASTRKEILLFATAEEIKEAEINIQRWAHESASLPRLELIVEFQHLDPYYLSALELIGFRPIETDSYFDSTDTDDNYNTLELAIHEINNVYDGYYEHPYESNDGLRERDGEVPGLGGLTQVSDKVLYSAENFIKVMKNNM